MEMSFALRSAIGSFDVTPDSETMVVYVERHRNPSVPQVQPAEIPSWCFEPETIWFYFGAPESEDKVTAGERIKSKLLEDLSRI